VLIHMTTKRVPPTHHSRPNTVRVLWAISRHHPFWLGGVVPSYAVTLPSKSGSPASVAPQAQAPSHNVAPKRGIDGNPHERQPKQQHRKTSTSQTRTINATGKSPTLRNSPSMQAKPACPLSRNDTKTRIPLSDTIHQAPPSRDNQMLFEVHSREKPSNFPFSGEQPQSTAI